MYIIFFLIFIIFYIFNKYILIKNINEHYLTYFLPYYDSNINSLANFYNNNENNDNYFKKKFKFRNINIGIIINETYFIDNLFKLYIAYSKVMTVNVIKYTNRMKLIDSLYYNKIKFCLTDYISINYYNNYVNSDINNFRFITNLYKLYFYLFTKKKYNIFSYNSIKPGTKIGIINNDSYSPVMYNYEIFFNNIGYEKNIDYIPVFYNNIDQLFKAFLNDECMMIFLINIFPDNDINNYITKNIIQDIILLPFDLDNEKEFLNKNKYLNIDYIDLNYLSELYFPKKFGNYIYNQNLPTLKILCTYKILLSNINTENIYTYTFIKFYHENINNINSMNNIKYNNYNLINIQNNNHYIISDYHKGVKDYFIEKGYFTFTNNNNCKYLVGKMECNENTLKNNNLFTN